MSRTACRLSRSSSTDAFMAEAQLTQSSHLYARWNPCEQRGSKNRKSALALLPATCKSLIARSDSNWAIILD